jgi:hypothetical protein
MFAALALSAVLAFGLSACDSEGKQSGQTTTTSTSTSSVPKSFPKNVPTAIVSRTSLPDCGEYDSTAYGAHGFGKLPATEQVKLDCFWKANESKSAAELRAITVVSIEGEMASIFYRTYATGKYEQIVLSPSGEFGTQECESFSKSNPLVPTCEIDHNKNNNSTPTLSTLP